MSQEKHTVEQVRLWASAYRDEGGHGLIVQMLESYAELLTKASIELELTPEWCHWMAEQMQRKADKDAARGAIVPVSYYVGNALGFARALLAASPADQGQEARDAKRYRFIKDSRLILSGGTTKFGWAISPFGEQCDRYIDAAMSPPPPA